jgi:hypothetical protein
MHRGFSILRGLKTREQAAKASLLLPALKSPATDLVSIVINTTVSKANNEESIMNMHTRNNTLAALTLLGGLIGASSAQATTASITESLGAGSTTDVYAVFCPFGSPGVKGRVKGIGILPFQRMTLQISRWFSPVPTVSTTSPPLIGWSPWASLFLGPNWYKATVGKTTSTPRAYTMQLDCGTGIPTSPFIVQDE